MSEAKHYVIYLSGQTDAPLGKFSPSLYVGDLDRAKRHCAGQVATNPRVKQGYVLDTQGGNNLPEAIVYLVRSAGQARADLEMWKSNPQAGGGR